MEERHPIEKWGNFFSVLGFIVVTVAVLDMLVGFGDGRFTAEVGIYYTRDEFSGVVFWAYLINMTIPTTVSGLALMFAGKVVEFALDFYEKVCEIGTKLND